MCIFTCSYKAQSERTVGRKTFKIKLTNSIITPTQSFEPRFLQAGSATQHQYKLHFVTSEQSGKVSF